MVKVTVFTPTYNRAYKLIDLYESLKNQSVKDFEWIIIDDGSNDNTEEIINKLLLENKDFPIIYKKTINGGKHRAINKGVDIASGKLFFIVDSDDVLTLNAIEKIIMWEQELPKDKYAGVGGLKGYTNESVIGSSLKFNSIDCTSIELRNKNIKGDKAEVFYTDVLKKYKFPEIDGENFIQEAIVWYKIAKDGYKIRWFNEIIYKVEYLPDGLSSNIDLKLRENFIGYTQYVKQIIKYNLQLKEKICIIGGFHNISKDKGNDYKATANLLKCKPITILLCNFIFNYKDTIRIKFVKNIR